MDHLSPGICLIRMNTTLCNNMEKKSFISLLYAILDVRDGTLVYSRAGHCPFCIFRMAQQKYLRRTEWASAWTNRRSFPLS